MDVLKLIAVIFFLALTACSGKKTPETIYPKVTEECTDQAISGRHLVRWASGHVTLLKAGSREEVLEQFVKPNLAQLDRVEPDFRIQLPHSQAAGDLPANQTSLANNWGAVRVNAGAAWLKGSKGGGITVAVVDSGMDTDHPQLTNQVAYNKGESGTDGQGRDKSTNGIDDDNNGLVDDYAGYDFTTNSSIMRDYFSHGTHVSGIIGAEHSDSTAGPSPHVQGIAPEVKILPLTFIDESGSGALYDAMLAIDYAANRGARVINASWGGGGCSTFLRDQITGLYGKNVIFVAAAGNDGLDIDLSPEYPAAFNLLAQLTVGAVGEFDTRAQFSNYGPEAVHLFAPGVEIISTLPRQRMGPMSGTSMAAPVVTGAVAALLSHRPQATVDEIRAAIYRSVHRDNSYRNASHGRLDLGAALSALEALVP